MILFSAKIKFFKARMKENLPFLDIVECQAYNEQANSLDNTLVIGDGCQDFYL